MVRSKTSKKGGRTSRELSGVAITVSTHSTISPKSHLVDTKSFCGKFSKKTGIINLTPNNELFYAREELSLFKL